MPAKTETDSVTVPAPKSKKAELLSPPQKKQNILVQRDQDDPYTIHVWMDDVYNLARRLSQVHAVYRTVQETTRYYVVSIDRRYDPEEVLAYLEQQTEEWLKK